MGFDVLGRRLGFRSFPEFVEQPAQRRGCIPVSKPQVRRRGFSSPVRSWRGDRLSQTLHAGRQVARQVSQEITSCCRRLWLQSSRRFCRLGNRRLDPRWRQFSLAYDLGLCLRRGRRGECFGKLHLLRLGCLDGLRKGLKKRRGRGRFSALGQSSLHLLAQLGHLRVSRILHFQGLNGTPGFVHQVLVKVEVDFHPAFFKVEARSGNLRR